MTWGTALLRHVCSMHTRSLTYLACKRFSLCLPILLHVCLKLPTYTLTTSSSLRALLLCTLPFKTIHILQLLLLLCLLQLLLLLQLCLQVLLLLLLLLHNLLDCPIVCIDYFVCLHQPKLSPGVISKLLSQLTCTLRHVRGPTFFRRACLQCVCALTFCMCHYPTASSPAWPAPHQTCYPLNRFHRIVIATITSRHTHHQVSVLLWLQRGASLQAWLRL